MADKEPRPELSYDGFGINGPDEHRTRLAKFNMVVPANVREHYGRLFEAAPELLAVVKRLIAAGPRNPYNEIAAHKIIDKLEMPRT